MSIVPEFACPMTAAREFVARPPARRLSSASYWVCGFETDFQWSGEKDSISSILPATFTPGTTPATCFGDRVRAGLARAQPCLTVVGVSLCVGRRSSARMAQDHWRKVEKARQRLVLCRLMIDIMRTIHGAYAPAKEPFGVRRHRVAIRKGFRKKMDGLGFGLAGLCQIAPGLKRAAIMFNPDTAPISTYMPSFETAARSLKVASITAPVHSDEEIETAIVALGREPGGGLVAMPDVFMAAHRAPIIAAAPRNNVARHASSVLSIERRLPSTSRCAASIACRTSTPEA